MPVSRGGQCVGEVARVDMLRGERTGRGKEVVGEAVATLALVEEEVVEVVPSDVVPEIDEGR